MSTKTTSSHGAGGRANAEAPAPPPPPAQQTQKQQQQQQQQQQQVPPLERSLSAPTRLKQPDGLGALLSTSCLGKRPISKKQRPKLAFRHSHRDQSFHARRRLAGSSAASPKLKMTISPLCLNSSSASDSAFSQSRSTLGSESGRSLSGCSYAKGAPRELLADFEELDAKLADRLAPADHDHERLPTAPAFNSPGEHFKIIWHGLTYRVPDKRLKRAFACLSKLRRKWPLPAGGRELAAPAVQVAAELASLEAGELAASGPAAEARPNDDDEEAAAAAAAEGDERPAHQRQRQRQRQVIFSNLNGCVKSGQLSAILGPSGAGKTTFLRCLTNDIELGVTGSISIRANGAARTSQQLKLCIIPQKDYLFDNLTVMENLLFASRIKNTQRHFDHEANVCRIASLLGLQACLKLKTSRLSGGQSKRVSIAQELLSQPDILVLDEPTSGLDSLTCYRTVSVLRELADMSRAGLLPPLAIVMTIHQPQIKIFNLFHRVYIMSSLGHCVYEGRPGLLLDTVAACCKLLPPPDDQNPASFIIDLASEVYGREPLAKLVALQRHNFRRSQSSTTGELHPPPIVNLDCGDSGLGCHMGKRQLAPVGKLHISEQLRKRNNHNHSFWLHTRLLIKRLWISMWRDSLLTTTRVAFHLVIPFVFYFVYSQKSGGANACPHVERELDIQEMVSEANIQRLTIQHDELILTFENVSLFFLLLYSFSMCVLAVTALSFPLNMQILLKETTNGWYTMPRFVMAKTLADLPIELTMPMVSVSIAYALTGQPGSYLSWRMLAVTAVMTLCSLISQTQGLLFGAYFMNNVQAAVFVSQASTLPWIMLSGFTTRVSQLPRPLQWLSFGSIYRLGIESIVAVRYGFGMCPCDEQLVNDTPPKIIGIPDQVKSVMGYYMDTYNAGAQSDNAAQAANATNGQGDIFGKIANTLARANTYGADIVSCQDVRPFIMSAREVDESTLPIFLSVLVGVLVVLKILLFYVVKIRAG